MVLQKEAMDAHLGTADPGEEWGSGNYPIEGGGRRPRTKGAPKAVVDRQRTLEPSSCATAADRPGARATCHGPTSAAETIALNRACLSALLGLGGLLRPGSNME